jgi:alpha-tubulin suppressor-like RCC1 family protein
VQVLGISGGSTIVAGGNHTCVLTGGDVWCWGQNSQGQIGDGTTTDRNKPVKVLSNAVDITAGLDYTCAVMSYGQVMCWGNNDRGQLANGKKVDSTVPTTASLITGISGVDAGMNKSCGITSTGLLRCLISDVAQDLGKLMSGTSSTTKTGLEVAVNRFGPIVIGLNNDGSPVVFQAGSAQTISSVQQAIDVDSGLGHMCALLSNGTVKCWGSNEYGQLGINSQTSNANPQLVLNVSAAWQLAVGKNHACVLITSKTPGKDDIQCWGLNTDGQLGNGSYQNSLIPVFVK